MKIGVLTHPLHGNYGGMLQAHAMVMILNRLGHNAVYMEYTYTPLPCFKKNPIRHIRARLNLGRRWRCFALRHNLISPEKSLLREIKLAMARSFQKKNIPRVFISNNPAEDFKEYGIDAVVVGSDQVWRDVYVRSMMSLPFFFLDFIPDKVRRRSIAYAASFGTDTWGGDEKETKQCRLLLHDFKAVSVREHSGVDLCKQIFDKEAIQLPDPTLLLETSDYNRIIRQEWTWCPKKPYIATYILDEFPEAIKVITELSGNRNIQPLMYTPSAIKARDRVPMSVPQWLRLLRDCDYLVTDSFHGCVFAIIFNKPFVCLGNASRGSARFDSLLRVYGLHNRMITGLTPDSISQIVNTPIDWNRVNTIRQQEKARAFDFLNQYLEKD